MVVYKIDRRGGVQKSYARTDPKKRNIDSLKMSQKLSPSGKYSSNPEMLLLWKNKFGTNAIPLYKMNKSQNRIKIVYVIEK